MFSIVRRINNVGNLYGVLIPKLPALTIMEATSSTSTFREESGEKSSVNISQVDHHSRLADDWWTNSGFMKALHSMNTLRVPMIRDGLIASKKTDPSLIDSAFPLKGVKILDVGCGGGILSEPLARLGANVTGLDASAELIEVAKAHAKQDDLLTENLNYNVTTAEKHAETHCEHYDAVVASEVIEHVSDQDFFVKKCVELLKPGGSIFITTLSKTTTSWLGGIIAAEYILAIVPKGTHDWNNFISPESLQNILEKNGCHTKLIHGMAYFPGVNVWCWSPITSINYGLQAVKS